MEIGAAWESSRVKYDEWGRVVDAVAASRTRVSHSAPASNPFIGVRSEQMCELMLTAWPRGQTQSNDAKKGETDRQTP